MGENFNQGSMFNLIQAVIICSIQQVSIFSVQSYGEDYFFQTPDVYDNYAEQLEIHEIIVSTSYPEEQQILDFLSDPTLTKQYYLLEAIQDDEREIVFLKVKKKKQF